jgi:hypothetical protein
MRNLRSISLRRLLTGASTPVRPNKTIKGESLARGSRKGSGAPMTDCGAYLPTTALRRWRCQHKEQKGDLVLAKWREHKP